MKTTSWHGCNQFPDELPVFNREKVLKTWKQYTDGNLEVRDELILQLLASCQIILDRMIYKNPKLKILYEELVSILTLKTCEWVHNTVTSEIENPLSYYWQMVKFTVSDYAAESLILKGNTVRMQVVADVPIPVREALNEDMVSLNTLEEFEALIDIESLAKNDREKIILQMSVQGFTGVEIAQKLQISTQLCSQIKQTLRRRYDDREQID
jgi:hypothetical protein